MSDHFLTTTGAIERIEAEYGFPISGDVMRDVVAKLRIGMRAGRYRIIHVSQMEAIVDELQRRDLVPGEKREGTAECAEQDSQNHKQGVRGMDAAT
ncbi:MAG: hypothetical protein GXY83_25630 [Rhodopirellula sp.]|nr:hypothetical protein [Rhodopirellula sp.]